MSSRPRTPWRRVRRAVRRLPGAVVHPLAGVARGVVRWWRNLPRGRARGVLAILVLLALGAGAGLAALIRHLDTPRPPEDAIALGPVWIAPPEDLGPWTMVPPERLESLRRSAALGGAVIDGVWGLVTPEAVVVTVLTAAPGDHEGLTSVDGPFGEEQRIRWGGGYPYLAGWQESEGLRELVLVVEAEGFLVVLSVSGPVAAFESGELRTAFRQARVILPR